MKELEFIDTRFDPDLTPFHGLAKQMAQAFGYTADLELDREGHEQNTAERALEAVARHDLTDVPLGHDSGHPPTIMTDYRTGGTPWTVLIGLDRRVLFNGFQVAPDRSVEALANREVEATLPARQESLRDEDNHVHKTE